MRRPLNGTYDRNVEPQPRMRQDALRLIRQAASEGKTPYVLANNRAEGNAPMTVQALVDQLRIPPLV